MPGPLASSDAAEFAVAAGSESKCAERWVIYPPLKERFYRLRKYPASAGNSPAASAALAALERVVEQGVCGVRASRHAQAQRP